MRNLIVFLVFISVTGFLGAQTINSFPYFTGFEGVDGTLNYNYPAGWTYEDLNGGLSNQSWQIIKNSPVSQNARTDSTAIHMFSSMSDTNNDWLYTPGIEMKKGAIYTLSFWYNTRDFAGSHEKCKVHIGAGASESDMSVIPLWDENNLTNETYQMATIDYTSTTDGVQYFGFNYYSDPLSFILFIDDVTITELVTGIESITTDNYSLSPMPCSNQLNIDGLKNGNYYAVLYDMMGRKVHSLNFEGNSCTLDVNDIDSGHYLLNLWDGNNNVIIQKQVSVVKD